MEKQNFILMVFLILAVAYLAYIITKSGARKLEHFDNQDVPADYDARLNVIKVFETVLKHKPTVEEIKKYSSISNEQDLLSKLMQDYSDTYVSDETQFESISKIANNDIVIPMVDDQPYTLSDINYILDNMESQIKNIRDFIMKKK